MKPILFSTPMVRAILDGRKTMTRRVITGLPDGVYRVDSYDGEEWFAHYGSCGNGVCVDYAMPIKPRCRPNDVLWVRETWQHMGNGGYMFRADADKRGSAAYYNEHAKLDGGWKPSIFMPREAARLFLRVKSVRAEQLQDITEANCYAEGIIKVPLGEGMEWAEEGWAVEKFAHLWNSLNAKRGCAWYTNPWVWVIEFERIGKEEA